MSLPTPYYDKDGITIYCGDCRDILPHLEPVDLVLTDPPYGVSLGSHQDAKETRPGVGLKKQAYASYDDTYENFKSIVCPVIESVIRIADRSIVFSAGPMMWDLPRPDAVSVIYIPSGNGRTKWGFQNTAHFLLYGVAPDLNLGAKHTALRSCERSEVNGHPCPKPLGWMKWCVMLGSRNAETILDPFMGSGTTLVAAKQLGRRAIGIEISEDYCKIAVERLAQGNLFGLEEPA